jgi:hypothetical protein
LIPSLSKALVRRGTTAPEVWGLTVPDGPRAPRNEEGAEGRGKQRTERTATKKEQTPPQQWTARKQSQE